MTAPYNPQPGDRLHLDPSDPTTAELGAWLQVNFIGAEGVWCSWPDGVAVLWTAPLLRDLAACDGVTLERGEPQPTGHALISKLAVTKVEAL